MVRKPQIIVGLQSNFAFHNKQNQRGTSTCAFSLICHRVMQIQVHTPSLAQNGFGSLRPFRQVFIIQLLVWFSTRLLTHTYVWFFFSCCNYNRYPSLRLVIWRRKYGLSCLVFKVSEWEGTLICTLFHPVSIWSNDSVGKLLLGGAVAPCLLPSKANKAQMNG